MQPDARIQNETETIETQWAQDERWAGITRSYRPKEVVRLRGSLVPESTVARLGAERLWELFRPASRSARSAR